MPLCYTDGMNNKNAVTEVRTGDLYFLYLDKSDDKGETGYKWHEHTFYEILFFVEGESEYVIENRCYRLKEGDVLFIKPGYHHFENKVLSATTKIYCLGFLPEAIESTEIADKVFENGEFFTLGKSSPIFEILDAARQKLETEKGNALFFIKAISEAVILMLNDVDIREENLSEIKNDTVQKILDYIKAHLYEIHKIEDISSALFFSDSYVRTLFKKEMNIGIMEYVRNKKVLLANRKIKQGRKPTEVFSECGFSNYPSFYRAYTSYFGYPPKTRKLLIQKTE